MAVVIAGDERPPKMLGSFPISDGKAETVKNEVMAQTKKWGISPETSDVQPAMTLWDTTNSNSGNSMLNTHF